MSAPSFFCGARFMGLQHALIMRAHVFNFSVLGIPILDSMPSHLFRSNEFSKVSPSRFLASRSSQGTKLTTFLQIGVLLVIE